MFQLRSVKEKDLDALFLLDQQCFAEGIAYSLEEIFYFLFETPSFALVAEKDGILAGFVIAEQASAGAWHLITIDVAQKMRRRGVGWLLMDAVLKAAASAGADVVILEVAVDNPQAQAFYRRAGFVETGRIVGYYMGSLDALTLQKSLRV